MFKLFNCLNFEFDFLHRSTLQLAKYMMKVNLFFFQTSENNFRFKIMEI